MDSQIYNLKTVRFIDGYQIIQIFVQIDRKIVRYMDGQKDRHILKGKTRAKDSHTGWSKKKFMM